MNLQLLRLWRSLVRAIGHSGPPALLLFLVVLAVAATTPRLNRELHDEYAANEARAMPLRAGTTEPPRGSSQKDRLLSYVEAFPSPERMSADLGEIYASAERHHIALVKGDYQFKAERDSPFVAYVASFPVRNEYGAVKAFASDVMQSLPHASLDELKLSRDAADADVLDAVVRFTLTYRSK
ncbi:MAG TPA: hypothetical protein VGO85_18305 [Caldimonas sp.]|nr:hypothetical protein [Caldimonas sp.]